MLVKPPPGFSNISLRIQNPSPDADWKIRRISLFFQLTKLFSVQSRQAKNVKKNTQFAQVDCNPDSFFSPAVWICTVLSIVKVISKAILKYEGMSSNLYLAAFFLTNYLSMYKDLPCCYDATSSILDQIQTRNPSKAQLITCGVLGQT